jgi:bile acid-coenzyme A ligase
VTAAFDIELGNVPEHFAALHPEKLAVAYPGGDALTWAQLSRQSSALARVLRDRGVKQDDVVTLALPNCAAYFAFTSAIWKLGATVNYVSHRLPSHELAAIVRLAAPRLVIGKVELLDAACAVLDPGVDLEGIDDRPMTALHPRFWRAGTSGGSTGAPKIIVDRTPFSPSASLTGAPTGDAIFNPGPLYHAATFVTAHRMLAAGKLIAGMHRFDAEGALDMVERHRLQCLYLVPTMMHRIWALPEAVRQRHDLSCVQLVWHYGGPMAPWLKENWIEWFGAERIYELYGSSEYLGATVISGTEWLRRRGSVGRLQGKGGMKILRPDGTECAPGEVGEIYFLPAGGTQRPYHYIGAEPRLATGGWESVGDLGHVDADGYLFLADRRTDLILRGGANVYPAEVEMALDAYPGVKTSIVVGLLDDDLGEVLHAIVEVDRPDQLDVSALAAHMRDRLAGYKLPASYEFVSAALRDDAGKARRIALREQRREWVRQGHDFRVFPAAQPA